MNEFLKSVLSLAIGAALVLPAQSFAQSTKRDRPKVPVCAATEKQITFPCRLVVGGVVQNRGLLRLVRDSIVATQERARFEGRRASALEVGNAVRGTPGIIIEDREAAASAREIAIRQALQSDAPLGYTQKVAAAFADGRRKPTQTATDVIDHGQSRYSSENFEMAVTGLGRPIRNPDDDGVSAFERAFLFGLGAVAVGSVLQNGDEIVSRSGDRVVVRRINGDLYVYKDENALLRRPGDRVETETFVDGSTRTTIVRPDRTQIVTINGVEGAVVRRVKTDRRGNRVALVDDSVPARAVAVRELRRFRQEVRLVGKSTEAELRRLLGQKLDTDYSQQFSLRQIRETAQIRQFVPAVELDVVKFPKGSATLSPAQARTLARVGLAIGALIANDPSTVILVEGHTERSGNPTYDLALSDRRAETLALALTEYFNVPPENMITQGYGATVSARSERDGRRRADHAVVRNITTLLR